MEWSEAALRLVSMTSSGPPGQPERDRLVEALGLAEGQAWLRLRLRTDPNDLGGLALPSPPFAHHQLIHVRQAAELLAEAYGQPVVQSGHVVLGLGITARACTDELLAKISDSFDLGTLEGLSEARNGVLGRMLEPEAPTGGSEPAGEPRFMIRFTRGALLVDRACAVASVATRVGVACLLVSLTLRGAAWWVALAGLLGMVSTQPLHRTEPLFTGTTRPWVLPIRFPWLLWLALCTSALGQPIASLALGLSWVAVRGFAHVGEYACGSHCVVDTRPALPRELRRMLRPAAVYPVLVRARETTIVVAAMACAALLTGYATSSSTNAIAAGVVAGLATETLGAALTSPKLLEYVGVGTAIWVTGLWWQGASISLATVAIVSMILRRGRDMRPPNLTACLHLRSSQLRRAALLIRRGQAGRALLTLAGDEPASPEGYLLSALAHLQEGRPGQARRLVGMAPTGLYPRLREYVLCRSGYLLHGTSDSLPASVDHARLDDLGHTLALCRLQAMHARGAVVDDVIHGILELLPANVQQRSAVRAMECYLALAEVATESPAIAELASTAAFTISDFCLLRDREGESRSAGENRLVRERYQFALGARATMRNGIDGEPSHESAASAVSAFGVASDALITIVELLPPSEVAWFAEAGANRLRGILGESTEDVLLLRVQALASLDVFRHELLDASDRASWWLQFERCLGKLLEEACQRQDWGLLAEVIEAARLQLGETHEQLRPTALRVRGRSLFAQSQFRAGSRPRIVDLEEVIKETAGAGGWWWATYASHGSLYWVTVPENRDQGLSGGSIPMEQIKSILDALAPHLPTSQPQETLAMRNRRVSRSVLAGRSSDAEVELAVLAGSIIPPPLRRMLATESERSTIAMSLAPELANVPWAWVVVMNKRLVEMCDIVIAPPASLVTKARSPFPQEVGCPVSVAVVDPGGDLPEAEQLHKRLPEGTKVVGAGEPEPKARLSAMLRQAPYDSTLVLACHTALVDDETVLALSPLRSGVPKWFVAPADLVGELRNFPMPRQVVALACESADVGRVQRGEWSVLGVSLIRAGAQVALVTAYPIPDNAEVDLSVLGGISGGVPLRSVLSELQLGMLSRWRSGDKSAVPLRWAGLQLMGTLEDAGLGSDLTSFWISENVIEGIDQAASWGSRAGATVDFEDLMGYLAVYGTCDGLPILNRLGIWFRFSAIRTIKALLRRDVKANNCSIEEELVATVVRAAEWARDSGHKVLDIDHVFAAALAADAPPCRAMRKLTGWDTRSAAVRQRFFEDDREIWVRTGKPRVSVLAPHEVSRLYRAVRVPEPLGEDRWFYTDRA